MKQLESKSMVLLRHHLKVLRLPTFGRRGREGRRPVARDDADHLTYLLQLCELELLERDKRAAERRLKAARFPTFKSLETFDFTARPSVNKMLVAELARCEFIDKRENVLLVGNPGHGQDPPRDRARRRRLQKGYRVRFFRATELVTTLMEARENAASSGSRRSSPSSTCSSSTSSATCPRPKPVPSCSST